LTNRFLSRLAVGSLVIALGPLPAAPTADAKIDGGLPILVYHYIRAEGDKTEDGLDAISMRRFEEQMRYLSDHGYTTLSLSDVADYLARKPFPEKVVAIHLDDGWSSQLQVVPILERYRFKATFWIIAGKGIGRPHMTWDEIQTVHAHALFDVGSHTMTHPLEAGSRLTDWAAGRTRGKTADDARWELAESRRLIEERIGVPVLFLDWPGGFYDDTVVGLARQAGYRGLMTLDRWNNQPGGDPFRIHRVLVDGRCGLAVFASLLRWGIPRTCATTDASPKPGG
jgi:peptidoglycan/xylan/chitin deacetylase (PgdA/CDA1 family)